MFIVETVYAYVVSILFASSGLDERQEDGLPEIGQDIKPKIVLVLWYPQLLTWRVPGIGDQNFVITNMRSVKHLSPNSNKSCISFICVCCDHSVSLISPFKYKVDRKQVFSPHLPVNVGHLPPLEQCPLDH